MRTIPSVALPLAAASLAAASLAPGRGGDRPLRAQGVCTTQGNDVACWDLHGRPSSTLTREVAEIVKVRDPYVFMDFEIDPVRKERFLLLRGGNFQPFDGDLVQGHVRASFLNRPDDGEPLVAVRIPGAFSATETADLRPFVDRDSADLPLRKGAVARIGRVALTVIEVAKPPRNEFPIMMNRSSFVQGTDWRFLIERGVPAPEGVGTRFQAYGRDGNPIDYVDRQGRPIGRTAARAALMDYRRGRTGTDGAPFRDMLPARIAILNGDPDAYQCAINVDPAEIGFLRTTEIVPKSLRVGPFPLDPRP